MVITDNGRQDGVVSCIDEGVLLRATRFLNINQCFGALKPAIFASMGPSFNQEAKGKKLYIEKRLAPLVSLLVRKK